VGSNVSSISSTALSIGSTVSSVGFIYFTINLTKTLNEFLRWVTTNLNGWETIEYRWGWSSNSGLGE